MATSLCSPEAISANASSIASRINLDPGSYYEQVLTQTMERTCSQQNTHVHVNVCINLLDSGVEIHNLGFHVIWESICQFGYFLGVKNETFPREASLLKII